MIHDTIRYDTKYYDTRYIVLFEIIALPIDLDSGYHICGTNMMQLLHCAGAIIGARKTIAG
jgi:hypothetical protein